MLLRNDGNEMKMVNTLFYSQYDLTNVRVENLFQLSDLLQNRKKENQKLRPPKQYRIYTFITAKQTAVRPIDG